MYFALSDSLPHLNLYFRSRLSGIIRFFQCYPMRKRHLILLIPLLLAPLVTVAQQNQQEKYEQLDVFDLLRSKKKKSENKANIFIIIGFIAIIFLVFGFSAGLLILLVLFIISLPAMLLMFAFKVADEIKNSCDK